MNKFMGPTDFGCTEMLKDARAVLRIPEVRLRKTLFKQGGWEDEKGRR